MRTQRQQNATKCQFTDAKPDKVQRKSGPRSRIRRELASLSYDEQLQRLRPTTPAWIANPPKTEPTDTTGPSVCNLQAKGMNGAEDPEKTKQVAREGLTGTPQQLPHLDKVQLAFAGHDLSNVKAYVGGPAAQAAEQMGASAYAMGDKVAFKQSPDVQTVAHEVTHVVQQRQGVSLKGGVGETGDPYEKEADAVAEKVGEGKHPVSTFDSSSNHGSESKSGEKPVQLRGVGGTKRDVPDTSLRLEPPVHHDARIGDKLHQWIYVDTHQDQTPELKDLILSGGAVEKTDKKNYGDMVYAVLRPCGWHNSDVSVVPEFHDDEVNCNSRTIGVDTPKPVLLEDSEPLELIGQRGHVFFYPEQRMEHVDELQPAHRPHFQVDAKDTDGVEVGQESTAGDEHTCLVRITGWEWPTLAVEMLDAIGGKIAAEADFVVKPPKLDFVAQTVANCENPRELKPGESVILHYFVKPVEVEDGDPALESDPGLECASGAVVADSTVEGDYLAITIERSVDEENWGEFSARPAWIFNDTRIEVGDDQVFKGLAVPTKGQKEDAIENLVNQAILSIDGWETNLNAAIKIFEAVKGDVDWRKDFAGVLLNIALGGVASVTSSTGLSIASSLVVFYFSEASKQAKVDAENEVTEAIAEGGKIPVCGAVTREHFTTSYLLGNNGAIAVWRDKLKELLGKAALLNQGKDSLTNQDYLDFKQDVETFKLYEKTRLQVKHHKENLEKGWKELKAAVARWKQENSRSQPQPTHGKGRYPNP